MWRHVFFFTMAATAAAQGNRDAAIKPVAIAGNVYHLGGREWAAFLIRTPGGLILLDTGIERSVPARRADIERAGFRFRDIRVVISNRDATVMETGPGVDLAAVKVGRPVADGGKVSLGGVTLTAYLTPGETPASTTWTMTSAAGGRPLRVVFSGGWSLQPGTALVQNAAHPSIASDYAATFGKLKTLECDVFLGPRGERFGPAEYRAAIEAAEARFGAELERQKRAAGHWPQFRGLRGSGVAATAAPVEFGPDRNVLWKAPAPVGHSSPVIAGDRIFLVGEEGGKRADAGREKVTTDGTLYTVCLDRRTGRELWRREMPRPRRERYQPTNSAASPSPVTDGNTVYVFAGDYGLVAYRFDGEERWRLPLGPFNNVNGHGSSPILHNGKLYLICDQDTDSYLLAVDQETGKVAWKVERPEVTRGYATPAIYQPAGGPAELIVPGAYQLNSYEAETGRRLWWVRGQSWQPKSAPVIDGDIIYAHSWEGGGEAEQPTETAPLAEILAQWDDDRDGFLSEKETRDPRWQRSFYTIDLSGDGKVNQKEWEFFRARRAARNRLVAIRGGGRGDITNTHVNWSMQKFLPNVPSPLLYDGVLYLIKDGGVLSAIDPATGAILKQGRLTGAIDTYYASPVAAGGKLYFVSQQGKVSVVKAGRDWEMLHSVEIDEECFATPAVVEGDLYLRTRSALYCFRTR